MAFEKISDTDLVNKGVTGLPDVPGLSTSEMQAKFDELSKEVVIPKINDIIDGLNGDEVSKSSKVENPITKEKDIIQNVVNAIYNIVNQNSEARHGHANKNTLDAITEELYNSINTLVYMLRGITDITKTVTADDTKLPTSKAIVDYVLGLTLGYQVISNKTDLMSLNKSGYLVDALAVKNKFDEVDSKLTNKHINQDWFYSWNIQPSSMDIYIIDNCVYGTIEWIVSNITMDNYNRYIICNSKYRPLKRIYIYGLGADDSYYYPISGMLDTNGSLYIIPTPNSTLKYINIQFQYLEYTKIS